MTAGGSFWLCFVDLLLEEAYASLMDVQFFLKLFLNWMLCSLSSFLNAAYITKYTTKLTQQLKVVKIYAEEVVIITHMGKLKRQNYVQYMFLRRTFSIHVFASTKNKGILLQRHEKCLLPKTLIEHYENKKVSYLKHALSIFSRILSMTSNSYVFNTIL